MAFGTIAMIDEDRENQLRDCQDGRVYPLGRALRSTFDADNHDSLGSDVTGLMIDLSRIPYGDEAPAATPARRDPAPPSPAAPLPPRAPTLRDRLGLLFGARRPG